MDDAVKYKVISLLEAGRPAKDVAEDLNVSYAAVIKLNKDYKEAKLNGTLNKLINVDKLIIEQTAADLDLPTENVETVIKGLSGLEVLAEDFQLTAQQLNQRLKGMIASVEFASDLNVLTDILCKLQTAFINKQLTQVNVQNNFGGDTGQSKYTQFLGDKPGA